jgi:hypothetical protein
MLKPIDAFLKAPFISLAETLGWKKLDALMLSKAPKAWPALKASIPGWKLATGALILAWPDVSGKALEILSLAHIDPGNAIVYLGVGLGVIGALDKGMAFVLGFLGSPVDIVKHPPILRNEVEHDFFARQLLHLRLTMPFEDARRAALESTLIKFPR